VQVKNKMYIKPSTRPLLLLGRWMGNDKYGTSMVEHECTIL